MKKYFGFILLIVLAALGANAQKIGAKVGIGFLNVAHSYNVESYAIPGYHGSVFFQKTLVPMLSLRPEIGFDQSGEKFYSNIAGMEITNINTINNARLYLNLRLKPPFPVYAVAGPYLGYALSGTYNSTVKVGNITTEDNGQFDFEKNDYSRFDYGLTGGVGFVFNLAVVKMFLEGRYQLGMQDLDKNGDEFMKNRIFTISVGAMLGL